jgi:hypothetical protein
MRWDTTSGFGFLRAGDRKSNHPIGPETRPQSGPETRPQDHEVP